MGKVTQILAHAESDSVYFKCGEDTYVGFVYSYTDRGTALKAIEAIEGGGVFLTSTEEEVEEHTGGNAEDVTDTYLS